MKPYRTAISLLFSLALVVILSFAVHFLYQRFVELPRFSKSQVVRVVVQDSSEGYLYFSHPTDDRDGPFSLSMSVTSTTYRNNPRSKLLTVKLNQPEWLYHYPHVCILEDDRLIARIPLSTLVDRPFSMMLGNEPVTVSVKGRNILDEPLSFE